MKILTLSDVYFPRVNGVSTSIETFHREFADRGHQTVLYAPAYDDEHQDPPAIRRVPSRRVLFDPEDRFMKGGFIDRRLDELRAERFDILHIQTPFVAHRVGVRLGRRLGLPIVETYHTYFEQYLAHYVPFLPASWMRFVARHFSHSQCDEVDGVIVPSRAMEDVLRAYGVKTRIARIPTGLRLEKLAGGDGNRFRERYRIPAGRPTLVHVGRVAHEKNIAFLFHVLREARRSIPDILLIVAGEGPARAYLQRLAGKLGLIDNLLFVGYQTRDSDLLDCYRAGDVFVFASRTETQGLVLLEAMALGVPVVSTAVMGTRDILAAGKGALVAEEDVGDFSGKVVELLSDPKRRRSLAEEARSYAATWSAGAMAERQLELFQDMVDHGARAPAEVRAAVDVPQQAAG